jgi:hypothetical protein
MKTRVRKLQDINGDDVFVPFFQEKYDEFYILSRLCFKLLLGVESGQTIKYFILITTHLTYNDDRLRLSTKQKRDINNAMGIDRQRAWKMMKDLVDHNLVLYNESEDEYKIPASIAWYGDKQTKKNLIRSYSRKIIKPNENF